MKLSPESRQETFQSPPRCFLCHLVIPPSHSSSPAAPDGLSVLITWFALEFYLSGITQHTLFFAWLLTFSISWHLFMFWYTSIVHFFLLRSSIPSYSNLFITCWWAIRLLPVLGYFIKLLWTFVYKSLYSHKLSVVSVKYLGMEFLGLMADNLWRFNFFRNCEIVIQSNCTSLQFHQKCMRVPVPPYPH